MLPDDIGRCPQVAVRRLGQPPLQVGQGQMRHGAELVDGFVGLETKVAQPTALLEIVVVDLTVPATGIPLQHRFRCQGERRTDKVHREAVPVVPLGYQPTDVEGHVAQSTARVPDQIGGRRTVRSGDAHASIPPVPLGQVALVDACAIQGAILAHTAGEVPTLTPDILDEACGCVPGIRVHIDLDIAGDQRSTGLQDRPCQAILADEVDALSGRPGAVDAPHCLFAQVGQVQVQSPAMTLQAR